MPLMPRGLPKSVPDLAGDLYDAMLGRERTRRSANEAADVAAPPLIEQGFVAPDPDFFRWPTPGRDDINPRDPRVGQGDGRYGPVRRYEDGRPKMHHGIDIASPEGGSVVAAGGGRVVRVAQDPKGYGLWVEIDHGEGRATRYAHLESSSVRVGDQVKPGQAIGLTGRSGNVGEARPHLHFEVREGGQSRSPHLYIDPSTYGPPLNPSEIARLRGWD